VEIEIVRTVTFGRIGGCSRGAAKQAENEESKAHATSEAGENSFHAARKTGMRQCACSTAPDCQPMRRQLHHCRSQGTPSPSPSIFVFGQFRRK
jgi:hypothetical protein